MGDSSEKTYLKYKDNITPCIYGSHVSGTQKSDAEAVHYGAGLFAGDFRAVQVNVYTQE